MPLLRCSEQKRCTLEEFYKEFIPTETDTFANVGTPMLNIVGLINDSFKETIIYALTSHATLLLMNQDNSLSPWFVALNGLETSAIEQRNEYYIEYRMTTDNQPWPNATVKGGTTSLDELKKFIIIAMTESKGWSDSNELNDLYYSIKHTDE